MIDSQPEQSQIDLESLFNLSYGMCIVTSKEGEKINGCVVNTVFQIVPEPPMIAVSINTQCLTHQYINSSGVFAVSILSQQAPMPYMGRFGFRSGRNFDKFRETKYTLGLTGAPILTYQATGYIEARLTRSVDIHTHTLFIGQVLACQSLGVDKEPMTYRYYRDIKHGKTPKSAATYIKKQPSSKMRKTDMQKYRCIICDYIYDPAQGDPDGGIEPGVAFNDLPDDWVCPVCGAGKEEFEPV